MIIFNYISKKIAEHKKEKEKKQLIAELKKTRRMIKAAEYAFDMALEKEDIDRSIAVISEHQRKYTQIYTKLRRMG